MVSASKKFDYSFSILHEEVSASDLFPDKTHEAVTETLFKLIQNSERGITIGLEGGWGSGKSTVIEFLKDKINKTHTKTIFFLFDAWAHEGDPLRRIFLESLIKAIDPECKDTYLNNLLPEITGRKKTVTVNTDKKTSNLANLLSISALLVPLGAALLSAINYDHIYFPWKYGTSPNFAFIFGIVLSLAPFFVLGGWAKFGERDPKTKKIKWHLIHSDSTENYTQDVTEDGERTSIEFERFFQKIIQHSIGSNESQKFDRCIIVVDNLDRVDSEHFINIWSTLQTFFQYRSTQESASADWMNRLWFIVPYDRDGLSQTWNNNATTTQNGYDSLAQSFLNKCFQVRAEVPEPVMSAWCGFCVTATNRALLNWPADEKESIINTFQRYRSRLDSSPTPRQIHNFVNQVGLLGMRWGGIMSAEAIALYAIFRQKSSDKELRQELLGQGLPGNFEPTGDQQTIKMELAGMLFGVVKEKGVQLLLGPDIRNAVSIGEGEMIKELLETHGSAFWVAWDAIKKEILPSDNHSDEYRILATKAINDGFKDYRRKVSQEIKSLEKVWRDSGDRWDYKRTDYTLSLQLMRDMVENKNDFIEWMHKTISKKLSILISNISSTEPKVLMQYQAQLKLLTDSGKPISRLLYHNLNKENWIAWLNLLETSEAVFQEVLPAKGTIQELAGDLLLDANSIDETLLENLSKTLAIYPDSKEWDVVTTNLISWAIRSQRELSNNEAYKLLLGLYSRRDSKAAIKGCLVDAPFWVRGDAEDMDEVDALPVLVGSVLEDAIQKNANVSDAIKEYWQNKEADDDIKNTVIQYLAEHNQLYCLWFIARDELNLLAIRLIESNLENAKLFNYATGVLSLGKYKWTDHAFENKVINALSVFGGLEQASQTLKLDPLTYAIPLYHLQESGNAKAIALVKKVLKDLSTDQWTKSFEVDSYTLSCLYEKDIKLDHRYKDAFEAHFSKSIQTNISSDWIWSSFDILLEKCIDKNLVLSKLNQIYFQTDQDGLSDKSFDAISKHLSSFTRELNQTQVMSRLCIWIDKKLWSRINWLVNSGFKVKGKPLEALSSRIINELAQSNEQEISVTLNSLMKACKVVHPETLTTTKKSKGKNKL